jgi:hypothetical protein
VRFIVSELIARTARLIPYSKRPKQVPSFVTAYIYEPQPDEPTAHLGNLYVAIEVLVTGRASEEVADLVIEAFSDHYYNQAEAKTPLERFESAIKSTNHQLAEFVNQGNAAWIGKMSAIVAVVAGAEIHLCQTGSADAYLYRGKSHTRIVSPSTKPAQPSKTFSSIASGELEASDKLLFTTPALVHQIAMQRLHSIISAHSPNTAIAELTSHLPTTGSERIGVLVIELTTPELAALQIRSEEPNEIKLGQPENTYEAVKLAATPAAQSALAGSRKAGAAASSKANELKPHFKRLALALIRFIREQLAGKRGGKRVLVAAIILLLIIGVFAQRSASAKQLNELVKRYGQDYQLYLRAGTQAEAKQTSAASATYESLQKDLTSLAKLKSHARLNNALAHQALPSGEPHSVANFQAAVANAIDKLNGLERINATTITTLAKSDYTHIELYGAFAYIFNDTSISVVNISTKTIFTSKASSSNVGKIVGTALSSNGDGVYILTKTPGVWFYKFDSDSLSEITLGSNVWEAGSAISSYNGNLYILSNGTIYRHLRTITGFSPKAVTVGSDASPSLASSHGLAIDGTVYTLSSAGLQGFLAGAATTPLALPQSLLSPSSTIRAAANTIIVTDPISRRIGIISTRGANPVLVSQISINDISSLQDASYDETSKIIYALSGAKLILAKL